MAQVLKAEALVEVRLIASHLNQTHVMQPAYCVSTQAMRWAPTMVGQQLPFACPLVKTCMLACRNWSRPLNVLWYYMQGGILKRGERSKSASGGAGAAVGSGTGEAAASVQQGLARVAPKSVQRAKAELFF